MFARLICFIYTGNIGTDLVREWYGCRTRCATLPNLVYLMSGEPFKYQDGRTESSEFPRFSLNVYEAQHHTNCRRQNYLPLTNREADMEADSVKTRAEKLFDLYQLGGKYCIDSLRQCALDALRRELYRIACSEYYQFLHRCYPGSESLEAEFKKVIADGIAVNYLEIRQSGDEAALSIQGWLESDSDLCFLVMDSLAEFAQADNTGID